ncbi:uncharacterized protein LAESUDRAFT_723411 [Laetiporus sulphureus 93-53]|uniref:Uncharacterized protein n=1 Tax=Laetiporus sulphureus 93-53 TaxID=1314785 RepID=A0A165F7J7_9APHY|nr:uncharacterized protein LAESUDRAFT_723411 [Laetiporus sulphureus 93-53]KZT08543.1 hypothetical protein LAESUDRAFT_723411 [Laetiporus sulphureus 93-53]
MMLGPSSRPSLPTSSSDFALPPSSSSSTSSSSTYPADDLNPFMLRIRRPSLLVPREQSSDQPHRSPLATSMISRRSSTTVSSEESESDRDKMWTDSPPSGDSGNVTPLLPGPAMSGAERDQDATMKSSSRPRSPSTPPSRSGSMSDASVLMQAESISAASVHRRRLSHSLKMPRILSLISESHPEENEVQSEAQFQRLVASCSELPFQPRTPRAASDRGRYPEEAGEEEQHREETPSDDGEFDELPYASVEPINIVKPSTPAQSVNGDDMGMLDSPGGMAMDVDVPMSISGSPRVSSWRYTPPPTSCAVRHNKRKLEDRYDPYPTAAKRRAVSPSVSFYSARNGHGMPRLTMPSPVAVPAGGPGSAMSSPIVSSGSSYFTRSANNLSSPTLRPQVGLASPVLRPILSRPRRQADSDREVNGAGEAVNGMKLE